MSEQEEESGAQNVQDASGESYGAHGAIDIPVPSEELSESDQTEDNVSEPQPSAGAYKTHAGEQSGPVSSSPEAGGAEQLREEVASPERVSDSPEHYTEHHPTELDDATQSTTRSVDDYYLTFLDKIKAVKESLKTSVQDSSATGITGGIQEIAFSHFGEWLHFLVCHQTSLAVPLESLNCMKLVYSPVFALLK